MTNKHLLLFKGMYLFEQQEEWKTKAGVREREINIPLLVHFPKVCNSQA